MVFFGIIGDELQSQVLLNLDSEEDTEVCIGCAKELTPISAIHIHE